MKNERLACIVIPMFNREATIARCLDSIAAQEGIGQFDIIVVDNNSDDGSVEAVRKWASRNPSVNLTLTDEPKPGACAARNKGLGLVNTPFVMFFDSDDVMLPGHLLRLKNALAAHPETDMFGWDITCQLPDGRQYQASFIAENALYHHLRITTLGTMRYAVRTSLIRNAGGWNEDLFGWNDFELGVRLLLAEPRVTKLYDVDGPLVQTYFTPESITGSCFSPTPEKWERSLDLIEDALRTARPKLLPVVAFRRAILAGHYAREGAKTDAQRLLSKATTPGFGRAKAYLCFTITRIFGRGAGFLSRLI